MKARNVIDNVDSFIYMQCSLYKVQYMVNNWVRFLFCVEWKHNNVGVANGTNSLGWDFIWIKPKWSKHKVSPDFFTTQNYSEIINEQISIWLIVYRATVPNLPAGGMSTENRNNKPRLILDFAIEDALCSYLPTLYAAKNRVL